MTLKVFISSTMSELRDVREIVDQALKHKGIKAWVYKGDAGARPENVVETSLKEVEDSATAMPPMGQWIRQHKL